MTAASPRPDPGAGRSRGHGVAGGWRCRPALIPAFVPAPLIRNAPSLFLGFALHRNAAGICRPGCSTADLAAAVRSGQVACDPLAVGWLPPPARADALMRAAWGRRTGQEGVAHRRLRGAAAVLLAAWSPEADPEPEQSLYGGGRCVRPDLLIEGLPGGAVAAEVGAVDGDGMHALLAPDVFRAARSTPVSHVAVLPFAGEGAAAAQGYLFRLSSTPPLASPGRPALQSAWADLRRRHGFAPGRRA